MRRFGVASLTLWILALLIGTLVGSGGYTFYYANGASYLSNDPRACVNCHIMREEYDGWQKASHHAVATCNDCHVPHDLIRKYLVKAENGYFHSKAFTFDDFHEPIMARPRSRAVVQENCLRCHDGFIDQITDAHKHWNEPPDCIRCHSAVGHGPVK